MENNQQLPEEKKPEVVVPQEINKTKTPRNINLFKIGTVNVYSHEKLPAPLKKRYEKHYQGRRHHLWFDFLLALALIIAIGFNIFLLLSPNTYFYLKFGNFPLLTIHKGAPEELKLDLRQKILEPESQSINLGQNIKLEITLKNNSNQAINNIDLKISLAGVQSYNLVAGDLNKTIDKLRVGETITNELEISIISATENLAAIQTTAELTWQGDEQVIEASAVSFKINSQISLQALARYYTTEGDQLGVGPLPPEVGKKTTYWVFWPVISGFNDLSQAGVRGVLPPNVSLTGKSTVNLGAAIKFNSITREISWEIGAMPKNQQAQAGFEVAIIPTSNQQGLAVNLLQDIIFSAQDDFTGNIITVYSSNITTDLKYDSFAQGLCFIQ